MPSSLIKVNNEEKYFPWKLNAFVFFLPTPRLFTGEKSIGIIHKRGNRNIFHFVIEKKIKKKIADSPPVVRTQFCSSVRSKQSSTPLHLCDLRTHLVPSHWNSSAAQTETRDKNTLIVFETNPLICVFIDCVRIRTIYIYIVSKRTFHRAIRKVNYWFYWIYTAANRW